MYIVWENVKFRGIKAYLGTKVKTLDSEDKHGQKNLQKDIK